MSNISDVQAKAYDKVADYAYGSPHLAHRRLNVWLRELILDAVMEHEERPRVLDVGAGHGSFTEMLLAAGCEVVATDVSGESVEELRRRYGRNRSFSAIHDASGTLALGDSSTFTAILFASVLHHIPDYVKEVQDAVRRFLRPGGCVVSIQDPLWYPTVPRSSRLIGGFAYGAWRLSQGDLRRGVRARIRRLRRTYDLANPSDVVEYHVVRQGVNERVLADSLRPMFRQVTLIPYWSAQSRIGQAVGVAMRRKNTFALVCHDYRPLEHGSRDSR